MTPLISQPPQPAQELKAAAPRPRTMTSRALQQPLITQLYSGAGPCSAMEAHPVVTQEVPGSIPGMDVFPWATKRSLKIVRLCSGSLEALAVCHEPPSRLVLLSDAVVQCPRWGREGPGFNSRYGRVFHGLRKGDAKYYGSVAGRLGPRSCLHAPSSSLVLFFSFIH